MKQISLLGKVIPIAPLFLIILGAMLWPEMELISPSLPAIKMFFNVSDAMVQNLLSANFCGFFIGVLFAGPLCDSIGRKKTCIIGGLLFLLTSLITCFCSNFYLLILLRFLQGFFVTAPIIASCIMLLEVTKDKNQVLWLSLSSACITLCMAIAPLIGSFINVNFGFFGNLRAIFIAAFIGIIPIIFFVQETLPVKEQKSIKFKHIFKDYYALLTNYKFMGMSLVISSLPAAYWIYTGISSLYMIDYLGVEEKYFGFYQGPIVASFAFFSITINYFYKKIGLFYCVIIGFLSMFIGSFSLLITSLNSVEHPLLITILMMFFVGGMVPANSLIFTSVLNQVPTNLQGSAQSIIQALRLFLASIGTIALGLFYNGPFLSISILMFIMLIFSGFLLFKLRNNIQTNSAQQLNTSH